MIVGEAFEPIRALKSGWSNYSDGSAEGVAVLDPTLRFGSARLPSMKVTQTVGGGLSGLAHRGLGNEGLVLLGGGRYSGYVWASAAVDTPLIVSFREIQGGGILSTVTVTVPGGNVWTQVNYTLVSMANTTCVGITAGSDPSVDCAKAPFADYGENGA